MGIVLFEVVLFEPEIPHNTGAVMRLCAATGARLHLIEPLGFMLSDKGLQRAGMDYRERVDYHRHLSWAHFLEAVAHIANEDNTPKPTIYALTTKATHCYYQATFNKGDILLFGPESRGLPAELINTLPPQQRLRVPMRAGERSLNLSMTCGIALYEAIRQHESGLVLQG